MEVKMDINELRTLENQITDLKAQKADLESRQQQVVIYHKYFNGKIQVVKSPQNSPLYTINGIREHNSFNSIRRYGYQPEMEYISVDLHLSEALEKGWVTLDTKEDVSRQTKDYMNMSEVVKDIRNEVHEQFAKDLEKARDRAVEAESLSLTIEDKYKKELITIREAHSSVVNQMTADYQKKVVEIIKEHETMTNQNAENYKQLEQSYNDLKEDKKRISLEKQLEEALKTVAELTEKNNRSIFRKLF